MTRTIRPRPARRVLLRVAALAALLAAPLTLPASLAAQDAPEPDFALVMAFMERDEAAARRVAPAALAAGVPAGKRYDLLLQAVGTGHPAFVRLVLDAGVHPVPPRGHQGGWKGRSALDLAITESRGWDAAARREIVALLLARGADARQAMHTHMYPPGTAMTNAVLHAHAEVVELLAKHGARADERTDGGEPALAMLLRSAEAGAPLDDQIATARALLRLGADPATRDDAGETVVSRLDADGADALAAVIRGGRALAAAPAASPRQTLRREAGGAVRTPEERFAAAVIANDLAAARQAVDDGAELNRRTGTGGTLLAAAVEWARPEMVALLLARGADPNVPRGGSLGNAANALVDGINGLALAGGTPDRPRHRDDLVAVARMVAERRPNMDIAVKYGFTDYTPLMMLVQANARDLVAILLAGGADPNATNAAGFAPLDMAVVPRSPYDPPMSASDRVAIIRLLLGAGARPGHVARDRVTPLARARRNGFPEAVAALEAAGAR